MRDLEIVKLSVERGANKITLAAIYFDLEGKDVNNRP